MHARLKSLQSQREIINAKIDRELSSPRPCDLRLQALKRQRLQLKDTIHRLVRRLETRSAPAQLPLDAITVRHVSVVRTVNGRWRSLQIGRGLPAG